MATPLTAISRYTGVLMAVMCALLMFAFVIGDPLMQYGGGAGGSSESGELVASWNGGRITERQLEQAVVHRNVLAQFQRQVINTGARAAQEDGVDLQFANQRMAPLGLPRSREEQVERNIVRTKIFAAKAQQAGMVVTDEMIVDYLRAIGFDRVTNEEMRTMLSRMDVGNGRRATIGFVFELLREAMLANNYLTSHAYAFRTILPEERWEDWKQVNERVVVEAAPLKTADFVDQVPEPTDEELQEFFEEHKNRQPSPELVSGVELPSRLPAFATPPRVKLSVLKADYNTAVEAAKATITDEQIAAYYEENKESFQAADTSSLFGDDSLFGPSDLLQEDSGEEDAESPAEEPAEEPAEVESEEAIQDEPSEEAAETEAVEESATEESATEETSEAESEAAAEESATEEVTEESGAGEENATEEEEEEEETADEPAAEEGDQPEAEAAEVKYQPLEEVADEIRRRLANQQVAEEIRQKMDAVRTKLQDAYFPYFDARLDAEAGDGAEEVAPPAELTDLQPIAEAEQLELSEIDLAPQLELRETPVGGSLMPSGQQPLPVWYFAFRDEEVDTYEPKLTFGADGSMYVVMVTERYEAQTPELDDIRDRVVAEWKRVEAAKLALAAAEKLAEEAAPTEQSLAEFLTAKEGAPVAADAVETTDPFALLTIGRVAPTSRQIPLRLSQPEQLVAPGPELLRGVFDLSAGKVGAQLNHDHSIAYVLRIAQKIGTENELRREFLRDGDRWLGSQTFNQARINEKMQALVLTLLDESGLDWERQPDEIR